MMFEASPHIASASPVLTQLTFSTIVVWVIEKAKSSKWFPWLTQESTKWNRIIGGVLSALTGFGIHTTWASSTDGHTLTIALPTLMGFALFLWEWLRSQCTQEIIYRVYQSSTTPDLKALAQQVATVLNPGGAPAASPASK